MTEPPGTVIGWRVLHLSGGMINVIRFPREAVTREVRDA